VLGAGQPGLRDCRLLRGVERQDTQGEALIVPRRREAARPSGHDDTCARADCRHDVSFDHRLEAGGHLIHAIEEEHEAALQHRLLEEEVAARARAVDRSEVPIEVVARDLVLLDDPH
jgi:hypothetical protein